MSKEESRPLLKGAAPEKTSNSVLFEDNPERAELASGQEITCWCGFARLTRKYQFCIAEQDDCPIICQGEPR